MIVPPAATVSDDNSALLRDGHDGGQAAPVAGAPVVDGPDPGAYVEGAGPPGTDDGADVVDPPAGADVVAPPGGIDVMEAGVELDGAFVGCGP